MAGEQLQQPTPEVLGRILRGEQAPDFPEGADEDQPQGDEEELARAPDPETDQPQAEGEADEVDGDGEGDEPEAEPGADEEPVTIDPKAAAESLGMTTKDFYDALRIPLRDDRGDVSLDELKRGYMEVARLEDRESTLTLERESFKAERHEVESRHMRDRRDLQRLMPHVRALPPEIVQEAQLAAAEYQQSETRLLHEARPAWRDPAVMDTNRDRLRECAHTLGFSSAEFGTIIDHRMLLALDELDTLRSERAKALESMREAQSRKGEKRTGQRRRRGQDSGARVTRPRRDQASMTDSERASQVASLLNRGRQGDYR